MRVSCNGIQYHNYKLLAKVLVFLVAFGFPLLVWLTLYHAHKRDSVDKSRAWEEVRKRSFLRHLI